MSDYDVGYKKPPQHSWFKKGTSGNPKGRPKYTKMLPGDATGVFHQPVTLIRKGKPKKVAAITAILNQMVADAIKGDPKARKEALAYYDKHAGRAAQASLSEMMAGHSPFNLTAEDEAKIAKHNLLKGVK
jgi:hypothetical protein